MMVEQMIKFRKILDKKGIEWFDDSERFNDEIYIDRTKFNYGNVSWSVINGLGTYGGRTVFNGINQGLLEIWGSNMEAPEGYLNAENAAKRIFGK